MMHLFNRKIGAGQPLIILHGLFGSSDNWLSTGKILSENYEVYMVDQRNHGQSPHSDEFNYPAMAADLKHFIKTNAIPNPIIIGHSMGGKVAMEYAIQNTADWDKLVVVDIAPKSYPVHHDAILEGLNSLNLEELRSRSDADRHLAQFVPEIGVRQFLLKNLSRTNEGFEWKINLPVITSNIETIGAATSSNNTTDKEVLFINGALSNYVKHEDHKLIKEIFTNAQIASVENAGHWVHAEKTEEFIRVLLDFLNSDV